VSVAVPSPNFFHRSHFDWEPKRFSVAALGYSQAISAGRAGSNAFIRTVLAIFISPIAL
jgi:hypothetical protein